MANAAEQAVLARILRLRKRGLGVKAIASKLNRAGQVNPRTGGTWSHGNVAAILRTVERREACGAKVAA